MAFIRILVDGYSLLHNWPQLARGSPRYSASARDELIARLTQYRDACGTPITIFFDGKQPRGKLPKTHSPQDIEVLYSSAGQTADQMIERAAYRFAQFGEILAVTDDVAERETVISMGGMAMNCANFIQTVESAVADLRDDIKAHNRRERQRFGKR